MVRDVALVWSAQDLAKLLASLEDAAVHAPKTVGRYALVSRFDSRGMAAVNVGRAVGIGGFARTMAVNRQALVEPKARLSAPST